MNGMPDTPVFPFVVGSGRSGTTLVRVMLDSHPDLAIPPEAFFPLEPQEAWLRPDGNLDVGRAVEGIEAEHWFADWDLEPGAFAAAAVVGDQGTYAELIRCLFRTYALGQAKPRYGSKTPQHVLSIPRLAELFPESRFLHVVRDGRDVAASFLDVHFGPNDLASAASLWRRRVDQGRADGSALGSDRYLECHYEDLLTDPETALTRVCAFLEIPFDQAMLRYHERDLMPVAGLGGLYYHQNATKPLTKGLRDWRSQMPRSDVLLFESIAGESLEAFGYERAAIAAARTDRMRVGLRKGVSRMRRLNGSVLRRVRDV
jgi:Sulfotransferase family